MIIQTKLTSKKFQTLPNFKNISLNKQEENL